MPQWILDLWHTFVVNRVEALMMLALGSLVAWLRKIEWKWISSLLYGLVAMACVGVIFYVFGANAPQTKQVEITPDNVEANIRTWMDTFGVSVRKESDPESYFSLLVTMPSGVPVYIKRTKKIERYITFEALLTLGPEHQEVIKKLSKDQAEQVETRVMIEMQRMKMGYIVPGKAFESILLIKLLPITSSLTEGSFMQSADEMECAIALAKATVVMSLNNMSPTKKGVIFP